MSGPASPSVHIRVSIGGNIGAGGWGGSGSKKLKISVNSYNKVNYRNWYNITNCYFV